MNKIILIGRLGKDPETKHFDNGSLTICSMATSEKYKNRDGETVQDTEWHNLVFRGKLSELAEKYLSKGSQLMVEGKVKTRSWEDKDGNKRYTTEVIVFQMEFLGGNKKEETQEKRSDPGPNSATGGNVADEVSRLPF